MTNYYVDTDGGTDGGSDGLSWANADASLEYAMETRSIAGDTIFMQGAASDSKASYTLLSPGTVASPVLVIGCIDGTTNEGASIVAADLSDRITNNCPVVTTSSGNLIIDGVSHYVGMELKGAGQTILSTDASNVFSLCKLGTAGQTFNVSGAPSGVTLIDCELLASNVAASGGGSSLKIYGGKVTTSASWSFSVTSCPLECVGVDLSASTSAALVRFYVNRHPAIFRNCSFKSGYSLTTGTYVGWINDYEGYVEAIGCSDGTSKASADTYQNYEWEGASGLCSSEGTIVRTGGADDGTTSGAFSYALENNASLAVPVGCDVGVMSPWMSVWVAGGSAITLTVYTTHDNAGTINRDLYENELWVEFYTPDAGDTTAHDMNISEGINRHVPGSTIAAGTDDTTSTWATHNTYKRSFATTVTPGYTGWAYARAKLRYDSATPVTVYVDPRIVVT